MAMTETLVNAPDAQTVIRENLAEQFRELAERAQQLLAAELRVPTEVPDDDTAGKVSDFVKQITACTKSAETHRTAAKQPHLDAGKTVDGFFKAISDPLDRLKARLGDRLTAYLRKKEAKAREERLATERLAQAEAQKARAAAAEAEAKAQTPAQLDHAIVAAATAQMATADAALASKAADVKPAELSRTRGDLGAVSSLRTFWDFKDFHPAGITEDDFHALHAHVPTAAWEQAIRSFIKATRGKETLACCTIFENTKAAVA